MTFLFVSQGTCHHICTGLTHTYPIQSRRGLGVSVTPKQVPSLFTQQNRYKSSSFLVTTVTEFNTRCKAAQVGLNKVRATVEPSPETTPETTSSGQIDSQRNSFPHSHAFSSAPETQPAPAPAPASSDSRAPSDVQSYLSSSPVVLYFAYGSNLNPFKFGPLAGTTTTTTTSGDRRTRSSPAAGMGRAVDYDSDEMRAALKKHWQGSPYQDWDQQSVVPGPASTQEWDLCIQWSPLGVLGPQQRWIPTLVTNAFNSHAMANIKKRESIGQTGIQDNGINQSANETAKMNATYNQAWANIKKEESLGPSGIQSANATAEMNTSHSQAMTTTNAKVHSNSDSESSGSGLHGVIYPLTQQQFQVLATSEGSPWVSSPVLIDVIPYGKSTPIKVVTFQFKTPPPQPRYHLQQLQLQQRHQTSVSTRYANLVIDGARHWKLRPQYIDRIIQQVSPASTTSSALTSGPTLKEKQKAKAAFAVYADNIPDEYLEWASQRFWAYGQIRLVDTPLSTKDQSKPLLIYVPGIDGSGLGLLSHFRTLGQTFDLRCVVNPKTDRSSWTEMIQKLITDLEPIVKHRTKVNPNDKVFLFAESMGACMALALALQRPDWFANVIVLNPATAYSESIFAPLFPLLPSVPNIAYKAIPVALIPVIINPASLAKYLLTGGAQDAVKILRAIPSITILEEMLPKSTLAYRMNLLDNLPFTKRDLASLKVPCTIIATENDVLIRAVRESEKLVKLIPNSKRCVLPEFGHAALIHKDFDIDMIIKQVLRDSQAAQQRNHVTNYNHDTKMTQMSSSSSSSVPICSSYGKNNTVFTPPNRWDIEKKRHDMQVLKALFSPVWIGLENVEFSDRPIMFIANHTMFGVLDGPLIIEKILESKNKLVRALVHPLVWSSNAFAPFENTASATAKDIEKFGGVPVNPRSTYNLLKAGDSVLLFPGGAREAFKRRGEKHTLHWNDDKEPDFVRLARKHNALIVPLACVGPDDIFNVVYDADQILKTPVLGSYVRSRLEGLSLSAGFGAKAWKGDGSEDDLASMIGPLTAIQPPQRIYFAFGKPIDPCVAVAESRSKEKEIAIQTYQQVKKSLKDRIAYLEKTRVADLYRNPFRRLAYEMRNSHTAPTPWFWSDKHSYFEMDL